MDPHYQPFKLQVINPKRLPQWQSKSKSTINHCRFETQIKLSIQKVLLPCPSIPYFAFVDLETVFHRVPRKVLWWALRSLGSRNGLCMSFSVSPSSRHGRLAWKVKVPVLTWRRPSSKSRVLAMMSPRNLTSTSALLSALVVSVAIVTVPLLPDVVWPGESSGNSCLS